VDKEYTGKKKGDSIKLKEEPFINKLKSPDFKFEILYKFKIVSDIFLPGDLH
jgi:hypothetical protein